jgi:DNA polymerase III subunit gamma/tau
MGQALYRKYRSKSLDEVVGQEHVTKTLAAALKQGRISHAYLLTGPRGVGKTSVARILAYAVNDLPYDDAGSHMDIIEIDAASNRRIDEIRELRDKVNVAPTSAKYKVYIIDEVHMLTREAFNALLKTLEEPPAHAIFILATTDAHKLPDTIVSRTQRFSFKPVAKAQVIEHLATIARQEKIKIDDDALELLAEHGEGSFRDSISLLDQASNQSGTITLSDLQHLLGVPPEQATAELLELTLTGAPSASIASALNALYGQGYQAAAIAKRLASTLRKRLLDGGQDSEIILQLMAQLIEVPGSQDPERLLEINLLQSRPANTSSPAVIPPAPKPEAKPKVAAEPLASEKSVKPAAKVTPQISQKNLDAAVWPEILQLLKQKHNTLYGIVRIAQPDFSEPGALKLAFAFAFHQKRLNESANRQKLADIIQAVTGQPITIEGLHDQNVTPPKLPKAIETDTAPPPEAAVDLAAISNIFGEAELLES